MESAAIVYTPSHSGHLKDLISEIMVSDLGLEYGTYTSYRSLTRSLDPMLFDRTTKGLRVGYKASSSIRENLHSETGPKLSKPWFPEWFETGVAAIRNSPSAIRNRGSRYSKPLPGPFETRRLSHSKPPV